MRVKRFFWVAARSLGRAHMVPAPARRKNPVEGDVTLCGRIISADWRSFGVRPSAVRPCSACESKVAGIMVARVR